GSPRKTCRIFSSAFTGLRRIGRAKSMASAWDLLSPSRSLTGMAARSRWKAVWEPDPPPVSSFRPPDLRAIQRFFRMRLHTCIRRLDANVDQPQSFDRVQYRRGVRGEETCPQRSSPGCPKDGAGTA